MFGSAALEVGIGLIFSFLVFSLLMSAFVEMLETVLKHRAIDLQRALAELLADMDGTGARRDLMSHPLLWGLFRARGTLPTMAIEGSGADTKRKVFKPSTWGLGGDLPSYIPSDLFAAAFVSLMDTKGADKAKTEQDGAASNTDMNPASPEDAWQQLKAAFNDDPTRLQAVARWYEAAMERASGWYKRRTQRILFWGGLTVAFLLNVNAALIGNALAGSPAVRGQMMTAAEVRLQQGLAAKTPATETDTDEAKVTPPQTPQIEEATLELQSAGLPIGWSNSGLTAAGKMVQGSWLQIAAGVLYLLMGWFAMALAATMGAPFWFDLLGRFVAVRASIKPAPTSGGHTLVGTVVAPHDPTRSR